MKLGGEGGERKVRVQDGGAGGGHVGAGDDFCQVSYLWGWV